MDTPLHAADFGQTARPDDIAVVSHFFRSQPFARIGSIITVNTVLSERLGHVPTIATVLQKRILDIANWTPFTEVAVIFESSDRANKLIESAFQGFRLEEDGKTIPVDCFFMPKSAADPALEVADFIMHAVGRQARRKLDGRHGFAPDFVAVFHAFDARLVSFMNVDQVVETQK